MATVKLCKMKNGEEFFATISKIEYGKTTIEEPMTLMQGQNGMSFVPWVAFAWDRKMEIDSDTFMFINDVDKDTARQYESAREAFEDRRRELETGIKVPSEGNILLG